LYMELSSEIGTSGKGLVYPFPAGF
jgi:hypothetical protein